MCREPDEQPVPEEHTSDPRELARAALERVKETAERRGAVPGSAARWPATRPTRARPGDPEPIGASVRDLLTERGWNARATVATLFGRWADLVGSQVADHCHPTTYEEGRLQIEADSTAWATHLRALTPQLMHRLEEELGAGVVRQVRIAGPTAPTWRHGPRHVRGRGPRDTYG